MKIGDFSVIDTEFNNIRERFDNEMKKMEDEMNKFRSELINKESSIFKRGATRYGIYSFNTLTFNITLFSVVGA